MRSENLSTLADGCIRHTLIAAYNSAWNYFRLAGVAQKSGSVSDLDPCIIIMFPMMKTLVQVMRKDTSYRALLLDI